MAGLDLLVIGHVLQIRHWSGHLTVSDWSGIGPFVWTFPADSELIRPSGCFRLFRHWSGHLTVAGWSRVAVVDMVALPYVVQRLRVNCWRSHYCWCLSGIIKEFLCFLLQESIYFYWALLDCHYSLCWEIINHLKKII